mmetsp:Transcript_35925/g.36609  ORF Transcript_35925/g.36609 Transcript_35925/m.36609 type:complete len:360 (+) Transcript_35925:93-1172(+)|eukprot:CAMPEP_0182427544 /NCGR_PEP_ID=MMETSP1167-20130531/18291_1 /TAXON_ID=2988 /ORGANISM="Mallomonas Sp, Strain CCMP3275" /LENGTH=359 /DNA_ID=CAMNT_0024609855 /DNA_START=51 /DNA_END=1130 /DNA_ORIENTATION=+
MGNFFSTIGSSNAYGGRQSFLDEQQEHYEKICPKYLVKDAIVTDEHIQLAKSSWVMIMSGENTEPFIIRKAVSKSDSFPYTSSLTWFYDAFYNKFFELCPDTKAMFERVSMVKQGRLIAGVISSALESFNDTEKLKKRLVSNTVNHNGRGIKSEHYAKMGEALVSTLEMIIGPKFDSATKKAWYRIYSYMLNIILPVSVEYEVEEKRKQSGKIHSERKITSGKYAISSIKEYISGSGKHSKSNRSHVPNEVVNEINGEELLRPAPGKTSKTNNKTDMKNPIKSPVGSIRILMNINGPEYQPVTESSIPEESGPSLWSTKRLDEFFVRPLRRSLLRRSSSVTSKSSRQSNSVSVAPKCPF